MVTVITQLVIGFSVFSAAILLVAYLFFIKDMRKTPVGMVSCTFLLFALSGLQLLHWQHLATGNDLFSTRLYVVLLLTVPPTFFFLSREILMSESKLSLLQLAHFLPLAASPVLPIQYVIPVALVIGAGYSIWIVRVVFKIRNQVRRFRFEMFFFGFFALLAILVLMLALFSRQIDPSIFYVAYTNLTGLALILVVAALISFPELLSDISEAAQLTYATSTLKDVNVEQKLRDLQIVMNEEKLYQNEDLNLALTAAAIDLGPHQLSELVNTQFGYGFSRYVREQRIAAAKRLLREDVKSSVLSISLMTGFRSQSNFYTAFREVTGQSPGAFRKKAALKPMDS